MALSIAPRVGHSPACAPMRAKSTARKAQTALGARRSLSSVDDRGDRWTSMEATNDPDWFVRFLDSTSTGPGEHHPAVAQLELGPDPRCLDVGCGVGEDARAIAELSGSHVVGIDV